MANMNIDHAQTNLRWCNRAWKDGELRDLALFLFRKAISQLTMADIGFDTQVEIAAAHLGKEASVDLFKFNEEITNNPVAFKAWQLRVSSLIVC